MKKYFTKVSSTIITLSALLFGILSPAAMANTSDSEPVEDSHQTVEVDKTKTMTFDLFHDIDYLFDD